MCRYCDNLWETRIPNVRGEIPSPAVARHHAHLADIADNIPEIDNAAPVVLLIGRDLPEAHHVLEQTTGPRNSPYAQKLSLGWVVIGETCLNKFHRPDTVVVNKTYLMQNGRLSICKPCPNNFEIKESPRIGDTKSIQNIPDPIFVRDKDDDKVGPSIEDREFLKIMDQQVSRNDEGYWEAPLPFRSPRSTLPNNRQQVLRRARFLDFSLKKDNVKMEQFVAFMQKLLDNNHAEEAAPIDDNHEHWYLPIFGVFIQRSPRKYGLCSIHPPKLTIFL